MHSPFPYGRLVRHTTKPMTKQKTKAKASNALEDIANQAFLMLISEDNAEYVGNVTVDDGQIEIGNCGKAQFAVPTAMGDGIYSIWRGKKYIVIEHDLFNSMELDLALEEEKK